MGVTFERQNWSLVSAFKKIFKDGRIPKKLHTDHGTEFLNKVFQRFLKENGVDFFTTENFDTKATVVERFNRTLKTRMFKYFTFKNTNKYIDILPHLVDAYNHSYHRSIGTKPVLVTKKNEAKIWEKLYSSHKDKPVRFKFNVGQKVRISKYKSIFTKGYLPNWTEEIFTINQRIPTRPPVYRLKDYHNEILIGTFYEAELQSVIKEDDDIYRVEKILKSRTRNGVKEYFIKWKGYDSSFNSWVPKNDITKV